MSLEATKEEVMWKTVLQVQEKAACFKTPIFYSCYSDRSRRATMLC